MYNNINSNNNNKGKTRSTWIIIKNLVTLNVIHVHMYKKILCVCLTTQASPSKYDLDDQDHTYSNTVPNSSRDGKDKAIKLHTRIHLYIICHA